MNGSPNVMLPISSFGGRQREQVNLPIPLGRIQYSAQRHVIESG
jgi:hypothetical protein